MARSLWTPYTPRAMRAFLFLQTGARQRAQPLIDAALAFNRDAIAAGDRSFGPPMENAALAVLRGERATAFDELESLNDRLTKDIERLQTENTSLRALVLEAESRGELRLARQANRCREQLEQVTTALATLQSVVVSEIASASAQHAIDLTEQHRRSDHPDEQPDLR